MTVSIFNYNPKGKGQANSMACQIGSKVFFFSYKTLVAVWNDGELAIAKNEWGPTTGKHLNWIKRYANYDLFLHVTVETTADKLAAQYQEAPACP